MPNFYIYRAPKTTIKNPPNLDMLPMVKRSNTLPCAIQKKMEVDYNADGKWSVENTQARYKQLAEQFHIKEITIPIPHTYTNCGGITWIYNIMSAVARNLDKNDKANTQLAIEYIADNVMDSSTGYIRETIARKLRNVDLSEDQKRTLAKIFIAQLRSGKILKEYKEYIRLFRSIGLSPYRKDIEPYLHSKKQYIARAASRLLA